MADAYAAAYRIPNLLRRLVGEGAVSAAFIPVFSRYLAEDKKKEAWEFANTMLTMLTIFLAGSPCWHRLFAIRSSDSSHRDFGDTPGKLELTASLNRIMFPYIFFVSLSALAMGILNSFHRFGAPAFAPVLLESEHHCVFVSGWLCLAIHRRALAVGVVVGGVLQVAIQMPSLSANRLAAADSISIFRIPEFGVWRS